MELSLEAELICVSTEPDEDIPEFLNVVYGEMRALSARRVWMHMDETSDALTVGWAIDATDDTEAVWAGFALLRSALHAAGANTPNWPARFRVSEVKQVGEPLFRQRKAETDLVLQ